MSLKKILLVGGGPQLAVYKHDWEVELGSTKKQLQLPVSSQSRKSLKCLWSEICFCLVLKFTLSNTWFQSLRHLALKVTILQAFKVEPFCPQKWYLNRVVIIPRDTSLWRHFGAKIVLTMADRKEKRKPRGWYYVAGAPNQRSCQNTTFTPGIQMYQFLSDLAVRARWVQLVRRRRQDFKDPH